jgi:hypothetical protein
MGWRDKAKQVQGIGANRDDRANSPENGPIVPNVPIVPPLDPVRALKLCDKGLAGLDPAKPMHGLDAARWRQLLDDGQWLRDSFAPAAFRNGWTIADLFGLWPNKDAWGGIADRLQGARSLVMDEDRAHWRRMFSRAPDQFNRGTYPALRPLWEQPEC